MQKILLVLLLSVMSLTCGCSKNDNLISSKDQVLHLNLASDPAALDPRIVRSLKDLTIAKHLFEGLMRIDEQGVPLPAIAEEVTLSEDCLRYTFHLRETFWSNGEPLTAYDFEYAWKKVLDPCFAADYSHMLYPVKNAKLARFGKCDLDEVGVVAKDKLTLEVTLESITPYFLELVAFPTYFPVSKTFEEKKPDWAFKKGEANAKTFVCNGPFKLTKWTAGDSLVIKKNPLYWDEQSVVLNEINCSLVSDNTTESHLFEKGKIDWLGQPISHNIATDLIGEYKKQDLLLSYPVAGTFWFNFNVEKPPFDHPKLRKAFSYAINRQEIITHVLKGNQAIATSPLPPSMALSDTPCFQDGNVAYANRLFDEALEELQCERKNFPVIVLSYYICERTSKIVQLVQRQWETAFGIPVKLNGMERGLYRHLVKKGEFQVGPGEWIGDFNDPIAFLEHFKYKIDRKKGIGLNSTGWENSEYIKLLDLSEQLTNVEVRKNVLRDAEKILIDQMPIAPLYHYSFDYVKQNYVDGVVLSPLGLADFKKARICR